MIFWYLWRAGLLGRADREKLRFFFGASADPLSLSRRTPPASAIRWPRALVDPGYARAIAAWLAYRADLYDGKQG
ncbi:MAG TPA: hypothetical protein VGK20_14900 [Candidatus Binatia bacterium]